MDTSNTVNYAGETDAFGALFCRWKVSANIMPTKTLMLLISKLETGIPSIIIMYMEGIQLKHTSFLIQYGSYSTSREQKMEGETSSIAWYQFDSLFLYKPEKDT